MSAVLGLDTSTYTTSAAWFDGENSWKSRKVPWACARAMRCFSMSNVCQPS